MITHQWNETYMNSCTLHWAVPVQTTGLAACLIFLTAVHFQSGCNAFN
jgi:hypothetical protein